MSLIQSLRPLLRGAASITLTLSEDKGGLVALLQPKMLNVEETTDAELATLQAALSRPVKIGFSDTEGDLDAELLKALGVVANSRQDNLDALDRYREAQAEAANTAKIAREKKAQPAAPAKTGGKPAAASSAPQPEPAPLPTAGAAASSAPVAAATTPESDLFD
jgi:hypothetical protein